MNTNTGSNADLSALLAANGAPNSTTFNQNVLEFSFTLADPTNNAVILDFIFGSEEFADQNVTDGFAVFVDGVNFAEFQDGSLVTFVDGANESNFNDNSVGNPFGIELDGITDSLTLTALLDMSLSVHTIKIVIADTQDSFFDSAVYLANMRAAFANQNDGGVTNAVPVPGAVLLFPLGIAAIGAARRRKA